jgi:hypothetical protein
MKAINKYVQALRIKAIAKKSDAVGALIVLDVQNKLYASIEGNPNEFNSSRH